MFGTSTMSYGSELRCALAAARAAGRHVLEHYGTVSAEVKAGASPVTAADRASSDTIVSRIHSDFPGDAILCEETVDNAARLAADRLWIVDPLDGTREFLAVNGEFSIMIGLVELGEPVVGVVYLPATDRVYFAATGAGAWLLDGAEVTRLNAAPPPGPLRIVTSRSHADTAVEGMCAALPIGHRRPSGSVGIKCALIAEGVCDLYAHPVPHMSEWDTCAPEVLLREAGGTVTDCVGQPLRYNKPDPRHALGMLACAPEVKERVLPIVSRFVTLPS